MNKQHFFTLSFLILSPAHLAWSAEDEAPLAEYFRSEVARIAADPLKGIDSFEDWQAQRPELQRQLREMLSLDPWPERTDLNVKITGTVERPDFVIENVLFESSPGLYVTGNLYRPKEVEGKVPAVLYVCGHAREVVDGISYGNKARYQRHPAWYAANGYVCLVIDTLQLGELEGIHHGTHREGRWWWHSRGYTSAGIEAWNGVRAIDYLLTRPEVDPDRIGVTGRSGGGATSWWLGAIDDRLAAVVPVAGITDLHDHLIQGGITGAHPNGVIEGHCDCMFQLNTYRWDYPFLAALVAPKPLLVENTDADPIFPEAGVRRVYEQLETVYGWYDAEDRLALVIEEGGHIDSEPIRHASFAFMNKWLKDEDTPLDAIEEPDRTGPIEDLKVIVPHEEPENNRNDTIDESFVPVADVPAVPGSQEEWEALRSKWMKDLKTKVFGGWPTEEETELNLRTVEGDELPQPDDEVGVRVQVFKYNSQPGVTLKLWGLFPPADDAPEAVALLVLDEDRAELVAAVEAGNRNEIATFLELAHAVTDLPRNTAWVFALPRGLGPTAWESGRTDTHIRRRFALIGQTLDGMRVWDIRRAIAALGEIPETEGKPIQLLGTGPSAALALWAAVFEPEVASVWCAELPASWKNGPTYLNLDRILGPPQALALLYPRPVYLLSDPNRNAWRWALELAERLDAEQQWPTFREYP